MRAVSEKTKRSVLNGVVYDHYGWYTTQLIGHSLIIWLNITGEPSLGTMCYLMDREGNIYYG